MPDESPARFARIDEVFDAALTRPPSERAAFVRDACAGDGALAREVMALLDSLTQAEAAIGDSAGALLEASGPLVDPPDAALPAGTQVGAYRLERLIGRGGMGNVYAATRADGSIAREVALKVVRGGTRDATLVRRLRQEQRILGALEHPRIARLYDSGVTADGAPFLVMELVQGTRLDEYVARTAPPLRERLRLFDEVCDAVAFAHQRLVVHRDLKPGNILVAGDGHVRLLDFGIARLVADAPSAGDAGPALDATRPGHLVLTPEYAAPEQARGEAATVAIDVYALGVVLHELVTGARPAWQRLAITRANDAAIERAMVPPSRAMADAAAARAVRGDLDRVILKALAPDPSQRYPSVEALREDVRRVRDGYPILARRASAPERALRFARRNPLLAAAWGIVAATIVAFVATNAMQQRRLAAERDRVAAARDAATAARDRANAERDRARATAQLLASLFERADPMAPGRGDTLRVTQVLDEGVQRVNRDLAGQPAARAELLGAIGRAYLGLGRYDDAQSVLETARALQDSTPAVTADERAAILTALGNLARARGRAAAAESLHARALAERADTVARATLPATLAGSAREPGSGRAGASAIALSNVGASYMERNRLDSAGIFMDSALAMLRQVQPPDSSRLAQVLNHRATLAMRGNDFPLAAKLAGEAYALNVALLGPDHPRVAAEMANLGFLLDRSGRSAEAEPLLRDALQSLRERMPAGHPMVTGAKLTLGGILSRTGRLDEAERLLSEVVTAERAAGNDARQGLPISLDNHAGVLEKLGRLDEARAAYREAYELQRRQGGDEHPGTAILLGKVADAACRTGDDREGALADFRKSLGILDRLFPATHPFRLGVRTQYGACLARAGRRTEAEAELRSAFDAARRAPPQAHATARTAGRELLALYAAPADSTQRSRVQAQLDSLGAPGR